MKTELVRDWMTPNPVCATPHTTLPEAQRMMKEKNIRRLPVVEDDRLVGIVTLGDIRGAKPSEATGLSVWELNYLIDRITLDRIMTQDPATVAPTQTLYDAARLMLQRKIAGLPVVEAGRVVGILTESDIFRMVVKTWQQETEAVGEYA